MQEAYHAAKSINERFVELLQKEEVFTGLSEQIPMMNHKEQKLAEAERAVAIEEIEMQFTVLQAEAISKDRELTNASVQSATEKMKDAEQRYHVEEGRKVNAKS